MPGTCTKDTILSISLSLFSRRGFQGVSIRDICKEVHIRESSIYYHFENKRAILEELKVRFAAISSEKMQQLEDAMADPFAKMGLAGETISRIYFEDYLMNDFCNQFMRLLQIEHNENAEMANLYNEWMFEKPLNFQSKVFSALMEKQCIHSIDSAYLAVQYYAPIFLYCERYLLSGELTEEKKEAFRQKAYAHCYHFFQNLEAV